MSVSIPCRRCVVAISLLILAAAVQTRAAECVTTCYEVACDSASIRYGKYCGMGHGGCPGEKPCDKVDACCKSHDSCVMKAGLTSSECHAKFIKCLDKQERSGLTGFSEKCPWSVVIPAMRQGISVAMKIGDIFNQKGLGNLGLQLRPQQEL